MFFWKSMVLVTSILQKLMKLCLPWNLEMALLMASMSQQLRVKKYLQEREWHWYLALKVGSTLWAERTRMSSGRMEFSIFTQGRLPLDSQDSAQLGCFGTEVRRFRAMTLPQALTPLSVLAARLYSFPGQGSSTRLNPYRHLNRNPSTVFCDISWNSTPLQLVPTYMIFNAYFSCLKFWNNASCLCLGGFLSSLCLYGSSWAILPCICLFFMSRQQTLLSSSQFESWFEEGGSIVYNQMDPDYEYSVRKRKNKKRREEEDDFSKQDPDVQMMAYVEELEKEWLRQQKLVEINRLKYSVLITNLSKLLDKKGIDSEKLKTYIASSYKRV